MMRKEGPGLVETHQ